MRRTLSRDAAATFALRTSGMALTAIAAVILGRQLGASGYGDYAWSFAWATALALPAALGADQLLVREAAVARDRGEWSRLRALVGSTLRCSAAVSLVAIAVATLVVALGGGGLGSRRDALLVALPILPLAAATIVAQGGLLGLGRTVAAVAPGALGRALTFLTLVGAFAALGWLSTPRAVALQLAATAVGAAGTLVLVRRAVPRSRSGERPSPREWLSISVPMGATNVLLLVDAQVGLLMLGVFGSSAATGVYAASLLCMAPLGIVFTAVRYPLGPIVARLGATGEREQLQTALRVATRAVSAVSVAVAAVLVAVPGTILDLFGSSFSGGESALRLLALAQVVNAVCAFNGLVLIMNGQERTAVRVAIVAVLLDIALCALLVPPLGARGAAIAVVITITLRNALNSYFAWRRLGLDTTVLGRAVTRP